LLLLQITEDGKFQLYSRRKASPEQAFTNVNTFIKSNNK